MASNGRLLLKRQPKAYSWLWSVIGYTGLLTFAFVIAANNMAPQQSPEIIKETQKTILLNKNLQYSLAHFSSGIPNGLFVLGVYQSGNDAFYHQFKSIAENYNNISNIRFSMVNLNVQEESNVLEAMRSRKMFQEYNTDDNPAVLYFYNGKEVEKLRLNLRFTNLGEQEIKKRIEGLINYNINTSP